MGTSNQLGMEAAEGAEEALIIQKKEQIANVSSEKAKYIEEKFSRTQNYVSLIADTATEIYNNPDNYSPRIPAEPVNGNTELAAQLMFAPGRSLEMPKLNEEAGLLGNVQDILLQINSHDPVVASTYVATNSGIVIMADYISSAKFSEGSDVPDPYIAYKRPWYERAYNEQDIIFTDVINDISGGGTCIVCAKPFYKGNQFMGVAGVGSYLSDVNEIVMDTQIGETGYAFLVDNKGQVNISAKTEGELIADPDNLTDLRESENKELADTAGKMVEGESGISELTIDGKKVYLAYSPLETLGWSFATVIEVDEVLAPAAAIQGRILSMTEKAKAQINRNIQFIILLLCATALIVFVMIAVMSGRLAARLTKPIAKLTDDVTQIGDGNLEYHNELHTGDEIETLSTAFEKMTVKLVEYINNLTSVTAEKERIGAELNVATKIQASMLPSIFPAFPEREEFDIYATMLPAKEVGGDFYDFFMIDEDQLAVVIGDVSGKGVPAALFMVIAKTLIMNHAQERKQPSEVFTEANRQLCESNEGEMFVTGWMGVLTISTGEFTYVNAGHNPPLLKSGDGDFEYLVGRSGFVLAGMEGMKYRQTTMQLHPGDILYIYTDGVTEATDTGNELYGEERLKTVLDEYKGLELEDMLHKIKEDIDVFVKGAPQFDDITMLALRINEGRNV